MHMKSIRVSRRDETEHFGRCPHWAPVTHMGPCRSSLAREVRIWFQHFSLGIYTSSLDSLRFCNNVTTRREARMSGTDPLNLIPWQVYLPSGGIPGPNYYARADVLSGRWLSQRQDSIAQAQTGPQSSFIEREDGNAGVTLGHSLGLGLGGVTITGNQSHRSSGPVHDDLFSIPAYASDSTPLVPVPETATPRADFDASTTHPASVGVQEVHVHGLGDKEQSDVRYCHPASSSFVSSSWRTPSLAPQIPTREVQKIKGLDLSGKSLSDFTLLTPDPPRPKRQSVVIDVSAVHPASISSTRGEVLSEEDESDPAFVHPASSSFKVKLNSERRNKENADSNAYTDLDVTIIHPASIPSSRTMSLDPTTYDLSHPCALAPIATTAQTLDARYTHPASISTTQWRPLPIPLPSDVSGIHPASSAFVTFDSRAVHPAAVGVGRIPPDSGDSALSHPAWVGFGYGNPSVQSSKL